MRKGSLRSTDEFNPLLHVLSPKYEILSEEQKIELIRRYRIKPYNLPKILTTDPAAKAIGAKIGDVIKVTRKSPISGEVISYRLVVSE